MSSMVVGESLAMPFPDSKADIDAVRYLGSARSERLGFTSLLRTVVEFLRMLVNNVSDVEPTRTGRRALQQYGIRDNGFSSSGGVRLNDQAMTHHYSNRALLTLILLLSPSADPQQSHKSAGLAHSGESEVNTVDKGSHFHASLSLIVQGTDSADRHRCINFFSRELFRNRCVPLLRSRMLLSPIRRGGGYR